MSKQNILKPGNQSLFTDLSKCNKSSFVISFTIEVVGVEVWHDSNEGWLDLGPCIQGMKVQYQLYFGQVFDIDILIWPHVAKIWCGANYAWVRTWQFLERRLFTFSIRHAFPVRVADVRKFTATVTPQAGLANLGAKENGACKSFDCISPVLSTNIICRRLPTKLVSSYILYRYIGNGIVIAISNKTSAKNDRNVEVYLPPLAFGVKRYFGPVWETIDEMERLRKYVQRLIWKSVEKFIPSSYLDGQFDTPQPVTDTRHQDAVLHHVCSNIMNREIDVEEYNVEFTKGDVKGKKDDVSKKKEEGKVKFELSLPGDTILAGTGRIIPFESMGDKPSDIGEVIVLLSSYNLPAQDDQPIFFINVDTLADVPLEAFQRHRVSHLYTRWKLPGEEHVSVPQELKVNKQGVIKFNDHVTLPLEPDMATLFTAEFLDNPYEVELRGTRYPAINNKKPKFFGYEKCDHDFGTAVPPKPLNEELDFLIAVTKIDAKSLAKGVNAFIREEYSLYPPTTSVVGLNREVICTNDINAIGGEVKPTIVIPAHVILESLMTLEVSMGVVGCKPRRLCPCYSRMFCLIKDTDVIMAILRIVIGINEEVVQNDSSGILTGFAIDTGDIVLFYLEGPRDGHILKVWVKTEDHYPAVKPVFSSSARYSSRIYPEFMLEAVPFVVLKMYVPLSVVLACPPVYSRPALPLPTRSAILKIGRLIASKLETAPCLSEMPTTDELKSFRLELCASPKPPLFSTSTEDKVVTKSIDSLKSQEGVQAPELALTHQYTSSVNFDRKTKL